MASETAADVYGFDLAALQPHADRVGPELASLVTPLQPAPATYPEVDYALGKVSGHGVRAPADGRDARRLTERGSRPRRPRTQVIRSSSLMGGSSAVAAGWSG